MNRSPNTPSQQTTWRTRAGWLGMGLLFLGLAVLAKAWPGSMAKIMQPYGGDFFFVGFVFFSGLAIRPQASGAWMAIFVLSLAILAELIQMIDLTSITISPNWMFYWTGTVFDVMDIAAYCLGVLWAWCLKTYLSRLLKDKC